MSVVHLIFSMFLFHVVVVSVAAFPEPQISKEIIWSSSRQLKETSTTCQTGNPIDDCWRCDQNWESSRKKLADCAVGFGRDAIGGRDGNLYVVTDSGDDPYDPAPGTLRYAVMQEQPLWITFDHDMVIRLKEDLQVTSYKTLDGRGRNVQIAYGPCILVYKSRDIWIDHCTLEKCYDGLIDAVNGSTAITISNNYMLHHNEVMLLGHSDEFLADRDMQVTIAFNYFGEGLVQRMPRCRHGYFHIVNNIYTGWEMYAIGGSANPTIYSQGNIFMASDNTFTKEVTKRETILGYEEWKHWNWKSEGDLMVNGAFFTPSGIEDSSNYIKASSMEVQPASRLATSHPSIGALSCQIGQPC